MKSLRTFVFFFFSSTTTISQKRRERKRRNCKINNTLESITSFVLLSRNKNVQTESRRKADGERERKVLCLISIFSTFSITPLPRSSPSREAHEYYFIFPFVNFPHACEIPKSVKTLSRKTFPPFIWFSCQLSSQHKKRESTKTQKSMRKLLRNFSVLCFYEVIDISDMMMENSVGANSCGRMFNFSSYLTLRIFRIFFVDISAE